MSTKRKPGRPPSGTARPLQFSIRLDEKLMAKVRVISEAYGVSINRAVCICIEQAQIPEEVLKAHRDLAAARGNFTKLDGTGGAA